MSQPQPPPGVNPTSPGPRTSQTLTKSGSQPSSPPITCQASMTVPGALHASRKIPYPSNFVVDEPVPNKILDFCKNRTEREFTHMRYSAVTCDPNDFTKDGFILRQVAYDPPRRTELFIVMTLHNEDEELFTRSMHAVIQNVAHLCQQETWGKDGWKKVVLCIISDGGAKMNPGILFVLAAMGCYQDDVAKTRIGHRDVTANVFEYTTQSPITPSPNIEDSDKGILPIQIIFCLKDKNNIDSRRWAFDAFGPILQPGVSILLDVGSTPGSTSFYHFWKAADSVGDACGKIVTLTVKRNHDGANLDATPDED